MSDLTAVLTCSACGYHCTIEDTTEVVDTDGVHGYLCPVCNQPTWEIGEEWL